MGSSIAQQLKSHYRVHIFDKERSKTASVKDINVATGIKNLLRNVSTVILAVKPQDCHAALGKIKGYELFMRNSLKDTLFISIAAGISTTTIEKALGNARVIRVMPNIGSKVGAGIACLSKGKFATEEDFDFTETLFEHLGETLKIEERLMNAATAISGSGPGFFYDMLRRNHVKPQNIKAVDTFTETVFIPALKSAARDVGFSEEQSDFLAMATAASSIALLKKSKISPAQLKKQVASKGGTTEAGFLVLEKGGNLEEAVKAALKRAQELERK